MCAPPLLSGTVTDAQVRSSRSFSVDFSVRVHRRPPSRRARTEFTSLKCRYLRTNARSGPFSTRTPYLRMVLRPNASFVRSFWYPNGRFLRIYATPHKRIHDRTRLRATAEQRRATAEPPRTTVPWFARTCRAASATISAVRRPAPRAGRAPYAARDRAMHPAADPFQRRTRRLLPGTSRA